MIANNKSFYLLVALLLRFQAGGAQSSCPLTIHVFDTEAGCEEDSSPTSIGLINADGQCNVAEALAGTSDSLLPGTYRAECVTSEYVSIWQSGCSNSDCSASGDSDTCDREFTIPSLYSRLSPPQYSVQDENAATKRCFNLSSSDGSMSIVFYILGDCGQCLEGGNGETAEPTQGSDLQPGTVDAVPTQAPTQPSDTSTGAPTSLEQVVDTQPPTPAYDNDDADGSGVASPTEPPTSTSGATLPESNQDDESSGPKYGIYIGAAVGATTLLVGVMLTGFILGRRLHETKQEPEKNDFEQSLAGRVPRTSAVTSLASPETFLTGPGCYIDVHADDEVSTLEDPTIFTRDNTVAKMMREAEEQETLGGLEASDFSLQVDQDTVDRTVWSRTSC